MLCAEKKSCPRFQTWLPPAVIEDTVTGPATLKMMWKVSCNPVVSLQALLLCTLPLHTPTACFFLQPRWPLFCPAMLKCFACSHPTFSGWSKQQKTVHPRHNWWCNHSSGEFGFPSKSTVPCSLWRKWSGETRKQRVEEETAKLSSRSLLAIPVVMT